LRRAMIGRQARRDDVADLVELVRAEVAALCGSDGGERWRARSFTDLGLTSVGAVQLRHRLTDRTGFTLPHSLVYDFPTPGQVIDELARLRRGAAVAEPVAASAGSAEPIAIVAMACRYPGGVSSP